MATRRLPHPDYTDVRSWMRWAGVGGSAGVEVGHRERALDGQVAVVLRRVHRRQHHVEDVEGVLRRHRRLGAGGDAVDEMAEPVGPRPRVRRALEDLPGADAVLPQLVALRRPVVAEHLDRAFGAVDLERRRAVLLHREAGGHDAEDGVAEVERDLVVVERGDVDEVAVDDSAAG